MNLSDAARKYLLESVDAAVQAQLEGKECKDFIQAALQYRAPGYWGGIHRENTLMEDLLKDKLKAIMNDTLDEIITEPVRAAIRKQIVAKVTESSLSFAAEAACREFLSRLETPISGDTVEIRLFNYAEENTD